MSSVYLNRIGCKTKAIPIVRREDFKQREYTQQEIEFREKWGNTDNLFIADFGHWGRLTVLDRETGYSSTYGFGRARDTETGYRDFFLPSTCDFWLASGDFDIRDFITIEGVEIDGVIAVVKRYANTVIGGLRED